MEVKFMAKASTTSKETQSTSKTKACSSKLEAGRDCGSKSSSRTSSCCGRGSRTSKSSK